MGGDQRYRVTIECRPHEEHFFGVLRRRARAHIFGEMQLRLYDGGRAVVLVTDDIDAIRTVLAETAPGAQISRVGVMSAGVPVQVPGTHQGRAAG